MSSNSPHPMSIWCCHLWVAMVKSLQLLSYKKAFNAPPPTPPQWTQGPGNWGTPRDRNVDIFGLASTEGTSQMPCMPPHTLTCGRSRKHSLTNTNAPAAAETWRSSIRNTQKRNKKSQSRTLLHKNKRKHNNDDKNYLGSWLTCHPFPGIWLKWAGSQTLSNRRWEDFCHSRAIFWQGEQKGSREHNAQRTTGIYAKVFHRLLTWLPGQHWAV